MYGLEYDLDVFHIVAVSSFNMVCPPGPPVRSSVCPLYLLLLCCATSMRKTCFLSARAAM